jgi:pantothenate synthetase
VRQVEEMVAGGERRRGILIDAANEMFASQPAVRVDYIELVDWDTLLPVETAKPGMLFAVAAWVGATRLIDNIIIN